MSELQEATRLQIVKKTSGTKEIKKSFEERQSKYLVLGFCGPVGSGIRSVTEQTRYILENRFGYQTEIIKVSELIQKNSIKQKLECYDAQVIDDPGKRYIVYQDCGNELRKSFGNDILGQLVVQQITVSRAQRKINEEGKNAEEGVTKKELKSSQRVAYLIDSLKHPDEVNILRAVYRNMFYLVGILCAYPIRKKRLQDERMAPDQAETIIKRDQNEKEKFGQHLVKTLQYADFFLRNNHEHVDNLRTPIDRYISLILGTEIVTPTLDEYAMYMAQSAALKSGCLSRQIGAVIVNKEGDIIAEGCNDVPKGGGGLYSSVDKKNDLRCAFMGDKKCFNDYYKKLIKTDVEKIILEEAKSDSQRIAGIIADKIISDVAARDRKTNKKKDIEQIILAEANKDAKLRATIVADRIAQETRHRDLIEFSRAVHAEMDAIVSAARNGTTSIDGGTLYSTTFPCHNCARHIIAAGIDKVYYIEPYEKSLAFDLHPDAIQLDPPEDTQNLANPIYSNTESDFIRTAF